MASSLDVSRFTACPLATRISSFVKATWIPDQFYIHTLRSSDRYPTASAMCLGLDLLGGFKIGNRSSHTQRPCRERARDRPSSSMAALRMLMASGLSWQSLRSLARGHPGR